MEIGLLWFDNDKKRALDEKVQRAAEYYQSKFGCAPSLCFVNPVHLERGMKTRGLHVGVVRVEPSKTVLQHHFWLGRESE